MGSSEYVSPKAMKDEAQYLREEREAIQADHWPFEEKPACDETVRRLDARYSKARWKLDVTRKPPGFDRIVSTLSPQQRAWLATFDPRLQYLWLHVSVMVEQREGTSVSTARRFAARLIAKGLGVLQGVSP